jgi:hypothetical protein
VPKGLVPGAGKYFLRKAFLRKLGIEIPISGEPGTSEILWSADRLESADVPAITAKVSLPP